jgi:hypothetical protein
MTGSGQSSLRVKKGVILPHHGPPFKMRDISLSEAAGSVLLKFPAKYHKINIYFEYLNNSDLSVLLIAQKRNLSH